MPDEVLNPGMPVGDELHPAPEPDLQTDDAEQAVAADPKTESIMAVIASWRDSRLGGGPIARDTAAWNQLLAELPALAAAIAKEI